MGVTGVSTRIVPTRRSVMTSSRYRVVGSIFGSGPCSSFAMVGTILPILRAARAPRRDEIAGDRQDRQGQADQRVDDARGPAEEIAGVKASDPVPRRETSTIRRGPGEAARLAVEDHRAGRRLDPDRVTSIGDERGDPRSWQRGLGTLGDQVELAQPKEPAERAAVPLRRTYGTGERDQAGERESDSGQRDDHTEGQR